MLSIGIIGLPNVGKSTLFNALVKSAQAEASNYPFCTIEPNIGVVEVPDKRINELSKISKSLKEIPTTIEFIDIAGLVKGAHQGEGLGNQFLAHIKDINTINLELILADLKVVEKILERTQKELKAGDNETKKKIALLTKIKEGLEQEIPVWAICPNKEDLAKIAEIQLITSKPVLYIANISENMANISHQELISKYGLKDSIKNPNALIPISAKIEAELTEIPENEQKEFLDSLSLGESGLNRLIKSAYDTLGLITFFTSSEKETRAWTIIKNSHAPEAASKIHTDMKRGFIAAEVCHFDDLITYSDWQEAHKKGKIRTEGKDYLVQDGDIILFRFNI